MRYFSRIISTAGKSEIGHLIESNDENDNIDENIRIEINGNDIFDAKFVETKTNE